MRKKDDPIRPLRVMTLGLHQSTKRYFSDPLSFLCSPSLCLSVFFLNTNIFLKGMSWSTLLLAVMLKLILIFFFFFFACSFFYSSSEPALFLVVDCETTRMFFIFVRSHPQHLFPIWQILEQKFLGEKLMVAWWFKNKLFAKVLHLFLKSPPTPSHQRSKALSTLLPAALLRFPLLV